jgi:hypothetical protein
MVLEIGRILSVTEPTAFLDEIKHRMYAPWNEQFSAARSCDLEAANCQSQYSSVLVRTIG